MRGGYALHALSGALRPGKLEVNKEGMCNGLRRHRAERQPQGHQRLSTSGTMGVRSNKIGEKSARENQGSEGKHRYGEFS